jgi:hypothetical protein
MPEYFYNFVLFKQKIYSQDVYASWRYFSSYSVKSDNEYNGISLQFIASRLVLAERVMTFENTEFSHVVVYEHQDGALYDANTITHTLLSYKLLFGNDDAPIMGVRGGYHLDSFYGLQWRRNADEGKQFQGYFPACVGMDDVFNPTRTWGIKGTTLLRIDGPLVRRCFPLYAQQLAEIPQVQDEYSIDRFGKMQHFGKHTSGRKLNHVTDNVRFRARRHKQGPQTAWLEGIMAKADGLKILALREYQARMTQFDHAWGDGHLPPYGAGYGNFHGLASLWYPLMVGLGYDVDTEVHGWLADDWTDPWGGYAPEPGTLRWRSHGRQIDHCLRTLFNCQQWLNYYWAFQMPHDPPYHLYSWWRSQAWQIGEELYQAIYDDWDNVTAIYFAIVDAVNVLQMILMLRESRTQGVWSGPLNYLPAPQAKWPVNSYPATVPMMPFYEVYPLAREPWLETPDPIPPDIEIVAAEDIPWDSGGFEAEWGEEEEDWAADFKAAIRTALAKLEFCRQWIGKIRTEMPWYRGMPMEKLAPENDEVKNPFDD